MVKKIVLFMILVILTIVALLPILKNKLKTNLALNSKVTQISDKVTEIANRITNVSKDMEKQYKNTKKTILRNTKPQPEENESETVVLHLKHGGILSGKLVQKTKNAYTIEYKDKALVVSADRIKEIEYKTQKETEWPYENDVVVKRTNTVILDGKIVSVQGDTITLLFTEGGGRLEMDIKFSDVENLMFAPVYNKESRQIEARLKEQFPDMEIYREGNIVLFTDSHSRSVQHYKRTIMDLYTKIYLNFFALFNNRAPKMQSYIVVFDDFNDYAEYAITDGVPFWAAVGYFSPLDDTLYLFNAFGERIEKIVSEVIVGRTGESIDTAVDKIKGRVDEKYHMRIDAASNEFKEKFWRVYNLYRSDLNERTLSTLRHEFAHEIFHNWGLQNIIFSKPKINKENLSKKKRDFLETKDYKEKEKLLMELIRLREAETEDIDMEASQSWLSEGIATYSGTDPIGSIDEGWLYRFQEMTRDNEINPIEFLTVFRMGSFPGLAPKGMLNAYAQSWAFTNFLMAKYREGFLNYQIKMADGEPKDDEEELAWLLESLGTDLPTLEKEFREYMGTYKELENPYVKHYTKWIEIWRDVY